MVGQGLVELVPQIPSGAQATGCGAHELTLRAAPFEEHHELETEEQHRVDGRASIRRICAIHQVANKRKSQRLVQVPIENGRSAPVHLATRGPVVQIAAPSYPAYLAALLWKCTDSRPVLARCAVADG
jgi:hypothetical protein